MIDAHIHLDQYEDQVVSSILEGMPEQGIESLIAVSMNLASSKRTLELAASYPGLVKPAYGFHPEQALPTEEELNSLLKWITDHADNMAAIGEIGLPYYSRAEAIARGEGWEMEPYLGLLGRLLRLAAQLAKPVVLHAVYEDAWPVCDLLEQHGLTQAHFHWFKGPAATVDRMISRGYYISFTPDILYEPEIQELARRYPPELVMAETDGPWPFEGPFTGRTTHPAMVHDVAAAWGALHGYSVTEARAKLTANTVRFYGL
ncbi:TatD family hydrolase [Paenibacillus sp. FSL R7-0337]|uniref:TatD family hydrolase n=1 Tax=Paenibacillus sp. FSL R7-0337 TaxID=1926588 RepID=UPI00096BF883|nr:TatD family hydrolase [Paenibacillus sp. FSL R7-0337]OMF85345.1 DNAase [Paenibacillus sp. FSL R7-0337]